MKRLYAVIFSVVLAAVFCVNAFAAEVYQSTEGENG